jgi:hypothetical protein
MRRIRRPRTQAAVTELKIAHVEGNACEVPSCDRRHNLAASLPALTLQPGQTLRPVQAPSV